MVSNPTLMLWPLCIRTKRAPVGCGARSKPHAERKCPAVWKGRENSVSARWHSCFPAREKTFLTCCLQLTYRQPLKARVNCRTTEENMEKYAPAAGRDLWTAVSVIQRMGMNGKCKHHYHFQKTAITSLSCGNGGPVCLPSRDETDDLFYCFDRLYPCHFKEPGQLQSTYIVSIFFFFF